MDPLLTVLLPYRHEGPLLDEAVDSVRSQTGCDWELLLIDSQADAPTRAAALTHAAADARIRVLSALQPGISEALNLGIRHARGRYLARMDADDRMLPERLSRQAEYLDRNPDIGMVSCRCQLFPAGDANEGYRLFVEWQNSLLTPEAHRVNRFIESPVAHPSVMFRKTLIGKYGPYLNAGVPEDYELWLRWMDAGVQIAKLPEVLLAWRDHPSRLSRNHSDYSEAAFFRIKSEYLRRHLDKHPLGERRLIVCGGSRNIRERVEQLTAAGLPVSAYTDVVERPGNPLPYIPVGALPGPGSAFFVSLIAQRGVRDEIRQLLVGLGHREERDFLMLA